MSNIKQLLEKANRKCEMRWRVFAFDPAKDNELVHTSKEAFDCIKMAGEYKMDLAKKNPNYIIEIIAESAQKNEAKPSKADLEKAAYSSSFMNRRANVTIDGKTYVKIGKDKWEYHSSQNSALGPSYSTAQLLQKIQQATKVELTESAQKNEEKEFTIKLVTPFGKARVCSWKANSVDAAVKEFLDVNPAYRENKKGAVIAESAQKNETVYDIHTLPMDPASNPYKNLPFKFAPGDIIKSKDGKRQMKVFRKAGTQYEVSINNGPKEVIDVDKIKNFMVESVQKNKANYRPDKEVLADAEKQIKFAKDKLAQTKDFNLQQQYKRAIEYWEGLIAYTKKNPIKESLGDDIVQEVKEEVKDGVKDIVQQDVQAKLNNEVTPEDYQQNFEDIDDDSDGIFGDELDNAEPDELE